MCECIIRTDDSMNMKHLLLEDLVLAEMSRALIIRCASIVVAMVLFQSLYFKFSGHPESIELFSKLRLYDTGRWIVGFVELAVALMLIIPSTTKVAALFSLVIMGVAVVLHLTVLGIESHNDHGRLFVLALIALLLSATVVWLSQYDFRRIIGR